MNFLLPFKMSLPNFPNILPGEIFVHVNIIDASHQEFIVLKKQTESPFACVVLVKQEVELINGNWQVVNTSYFT